MSRYNRTKVKTKNKKQYYIATAYNKPASKFRPIFYS